MSNNNNNSTHKLVNLPHILLSNIVDNLKDNIDKICFSLVCKRWFDNRNRYLLFNTKNFYCNYKDRSKITMNSYRSLIFESLNQKKQRTMFVTKDKNYIYHYDYTIDYDSIESIDEIDQNIVKVIESREMILREDSDKLYTRLYELIGKSNVTGLRKCMTLKYGIPMNITSLAFSYYFNEALFKGCFPPNLKKLKFVGQFNQVIEVGVLPDTLESLEIGHLNQILEPGVLPTSLKILRITGSAPDNYLKVGSLPPNLEEFIQNGAYINIDSNVLPNSLITLGKVPLPWMKSIKPLENLRSLMVRRSTGCLDLSDLPQSLTRLDIFHSLSVLKSLPTSIKHLNIAYSEYDIDELFPDRSLYHFESLQVSPFKQESLDGLDIKRLLMEDDSVGEENSLATLRVIPFGVETLDIDVQCNFKFNQNSLPSSLKTLNVYHMNSFIHPGIIPNSVNHLIIQVPRCDIHIAEGILPDSVQNIELKQVVFPTSSIVDNISFEDYNFNKCSIRKLDDQYYIVFGHQKNKPFLIASLFHKSMFLDRVNVVKILNGE
ncbi:hypothetical protein PPL_10800 [Heterostelium album PN500]|uniref:F-box domain-containing protein n=1 Tax=Heterostelium pallidum (strain ATCC 26659 / Pp 5 / PN500) TaxID=670386 RepID=D3BS09_HETP5|nr:hypothetical protein PPL_10800 [Heterostelium album PN500]EFA75746.1 hypothetical protein PPL_10800 [Heterostelium album PN500]|eukprot:XP_020427880.1 hypothetical protein PPL_10800 [Heterostelium album PN500]